MSFMGYIRVKLTGNDVASFIRLCHNNNVPLCNIKTIMNSCFADIKSKHYKAFSELARKYGADYEIIGKFGFLMKIILYKSRKAFFGILLILSLYYGINSCFISEIVLNGNNIFPDSQIIQCLEDNGLYVGRMKFGINPEIFQNEVIKDFSAISWIWVKIDGTKAIVDIREKVTKPKFYDSGAVCNMVASRDGVITSAISSGGTLLVKEGMYVRKGDILISGVYDFTDFAPVRFVNASGNVFAKTVYTMEDNFGYNFVSYKANKEVKSKITPRLFDMYLWNHTSAKPGDLVMPPQNVKFRIFGKNYLPLAFTKTKYCEIISKEYTLSEYDAQSYAIEELSRRLSLTLPDGADVINIMKNVTPNSDGSFKASVSFECVEDIATPAPILIEAD